MFETFRSGPRQGNRVQGKSIRLFLEELEGRCLLSGFVNSFGFPGLDPLGITPGPDGNLWFSEHKYIGRINPTNGVIEEFQLPRSPSLTGCITAGSVRPQLS